MPAAPEPATPEPGDRAAAPPPGAGLLTVPNAITLARLCAVPATIWLILQHRLDLAFWLFVAAGISDAIDGWYARTRNARSAVGALLDPAADKALLVSVYLALAYVDVLPDWLAILVVFRDALIVGGVAILYLAGLRPAIRPSRISKVNTALQIGLAATALLLSGFGLRAGPLLLALILLVAASTLASGASYVRAAVREAHGAPPR